MFEADDDIDVDDDFLEGVFENEELGFDSANHQNALALTVEPRPNFHPARSDTVENSQFLNRPHFPISTPTYSGKKDSSTVSTNNLSLGVDDHTPNYNKENKRKQTSSPRPLRTKRERRFPGPAGLLPDRKLSGCTPVKLDAVLETDNTTPEASTDELCSQGRCSGSVLEDEPWQSLIYDLGPDRGILDIVNVANVKRKAAARCFMGKKVPFLAAVLHHLDVSSPDPCVILRDGTGEIHGTLHREVWDQFAGDLIVGSVLVVRNAGLLSTGLSARRHYLNITANNLVTIYSASSDKFGKARHHTFTKPDFGQVIENWRALVSPSNGIGSPASIGSPTLFNSSFGSPRVSSPVQNMNNSVSCLSRRTELQLKSNLRPQNVRLKTAQNLQCSTPSRTSSTLPMHSKAAVRSLVPSFTHVTQQDKQVLNVNKTLNGDKLLNSTKPLQNNYTVPPSVHSKINPRMNSSNLACAMDVNSRSKTFNFSPVIIKPNISSMNILLHCESGSPQQLVNNNCETNASVRNNKTNIILSQTSQLTAEEQSVVESVFDGFDADSLFDDDF